MFRESPIAKLVGSYVVERFIDGGKHLELVTGDLFMNVYIDKVKKYCTLEIHINAQSKYVINGNRDLQEFNKIIGTVWPSRITRSYSWEVLIDEFVVKFIESSDSRDEQHDFLKAIRVGIDGLGKDKSGLSLAEMMSHPMQTFLKVVLSSASRTMELQKKMPKSWYVGQGYKKLQ